jgi:hypothetical protein
VGALPTRSQVNRVLANSADNFNDLYTGLERLHGVVHCAIGGTMCSYYDTTLGYYGLGAANAPEFWLHHANTDRLWSIWQARTVAHLNSYNSNIDSELPHTTYSAYLGPNSVTPRDMLDLSSQPGGIVVNYELLGGDTTLNVLGAFSTRTSDEQVPPLAPTLLHDMPTPDCPDESMYISYEKWLSLADIDEAETATQLQAFRESACPNNQAPVTGRTEDTVNTETCASAAPKKRGKRLTGKTCSTTVEV